MPVYYRSLDGIRAIAVSLVFIEHFAHAIGKNMNAGFIGVDLFFVLSGYLITGILINEKGGFLNSYKRFLGRRSLRIFPLYYGMLAVMYLFNTDDIRNWFIFLATYTYNYAHVYFDIDSKAYTHFWSLGVEEQFYLFWPLVVLALRRYPRILEGVIVTGILLCSLHIIFNLFPAIQPFNPVALFPRLMSLLVGGWVSIRYQKIIQKEAFFKNSMVEAMMWIGLVGIMLSSSQWVMVFFPFIAILIILKAITGTFKWTWFGRQLEKPGMVRVGKVSYGLYIFHLPLAFYFTEYIFTPLWNQVPFHNFGRLGVLQFHSYIIKLPLYSILSFGIASISYQYFEKPILRLKDRYFA